MIARSWLDDPNERPPLTIVPDPPDPPALPFRAACLPEYRRRLLGVYAAVAGWPRERVAPLWPLIEQADAALLAEDAAEWLGALGELEKHVGVRA